MRVSEQTLRKRARELNLKLSRKKGMYSIYEYYSTCNAMVPIQDCWGENPYCLFLNEVAEILAKEK